MMIRKEDVWIVPGIEVKGNQIRARGIILEDMDPPFGKDGDFDDRDFDDDPPPSQMIREDDVWIVPGVVVKKNRIEAAGIALVDNGPLVGKDDGFNDRDFGDRDEDFDS